MTKSQARRAQSWWIERESDEQDYRPKVKEIVEDKQPLSEATTFSPFEDGYRRY